MGVHLVEAGPEGLGDGSLPEDEAKYEISVYFLRFPVENVGFNEYRSRVLTV